MFANHRLKEGCTVYMTARRKEDNILSFQSLAHNFLVNWFLVSSFQSNAVNTTTILKQEVSRGNV